MTLIPKEKGTEDPAKTRPITVSSVLVYLFNKIFAKQLEEQCPVSPRQKAFRRGDGIAENIHTLQSAIRHASQQKTRADPNKMSVFSMSRKPSTQLVMIVCKLPVEDLVCPNPCSNIYMARTSGAQPAFKVVVSKARRSPASKE